MRLGVRWQSELKADAVVRLIWSAFLVLALGSLAGAAPWDDCMQNDDMALKVSACTNVIDADGTKPRDRITATLHRGYARRRTDDVVGALEDVEWVIDKSPSWGHAHYQYGLLMIRRDDHYAALRSLDVAVRLMAEKSFVWLERGRTNHALGNHWAAAQDVNESLRLRPDHGPALHSRALIRCGQERGDDALADWAFLRELDPDALTDQTRMLAEQGFWSGAVPTADDERLDTALSNFVAAGCPVVVN